MNISEFLQFLKNAYDLKNGTAAVILASHFLGISESALWKLKKSENQPSTQTLLIIDIIVYLTRNQGCEFVKKMYNVVRPHFDIPGLG